MSFLPLDEIRGKATVNLAPMIDFLFLMLAFFASLALSRVATRETEVELVQITPEARAATAEPDAPLKIVELLVTREGEYRWVTELRDYEMESSEAVAQELQEQLERGLLPPDKSQTQLLLKIDKEAQWEPIVELLFAVRDAGFEIRPVYEPTPSGAL